MTKYRRMIFQRRHESHLMYLIRLYGYNWKDYLFGFIAGCFIVWFVVYSVEARAADSGLKLRIMECESGLQHDKSGDGGLSYGIAQFRRATFYEFAKLSIKDKTWNFRKLGKPRWHNPQQQAHLLEWGLNNGYESRWKNCYKRAIGG